VSDSGARVGGTVVAVGAEVWVGLQEVTTQTAIAPSMSFTRWRFISNLLHTFAVLPFFVRLWFKPDFFIFIVQPLCASEELYRGLYKQSYFRRLPIIASN
jgi:hypothetical protein